MGGGKGGEHQTSFSRIPDSAHSADTKIETAICQINFSDSVTTNVVSLADDSFG